MTTMERTHGSAVRVLHNEAEYDRAVAELDRLLALDPARGTPEYAMLELLTVLVRVYDEEHYQMGNAATPQEVIEFLLDQHGMERAQLAPILGGRSRVSEFFAGKRHLSLVQIYKLREIFRVSADLL